MDPNKHEPDLCLSGTSEIALAGYLSNSIFDIKELPLKLCAVSRCYRAETSGLSEERGIFRYVGTFVGGTTKQTYIRVVPIFQVLIFFGSTL